MVVDSQREFVMPVQALRDRLTILNSRHDIKVHQIDKAWEDYQAGLVAQLAVELNSIQAEINLIERMLAGDWKYGGSNGG